MKNIFSMGFARRAKWLLMLPVILLCGELLAQNVAINADGSKPNANAILDIKSSNKGLLIPRMTTDARLKIEPTQGLMVYDINTNSFWYNTGKAWQSISTSEAMSASGAWLLTGNAGTMDGVNFIGTTDAVPFNVRVNNLASGRIDFRLQNTFWGYKSGMSVFASPGFPANNNTGIGFEALDALTGGWENTAVGAQALTNHTFGRDNTAVGYGTLFFNETGEMNTAIGASALFFAMGNYNTAVGGNALRANSTGHLNTAVGYNALQFNSSASQNTAVGSFALASNVNGTENTAVGASALQFNTSGQLNTAMGLEALHSNTNGGHNTALGSHALKNNNTGGGNTGVGSQALFTNRGGIQNTAVGGFALQFNRVGQDNTAIGYLAMRSNDNGNRNTAVGLRSLAGNGSNNSVLGVDAMTSNQTGRDNTAVGAGAMFSNTTGWFNTSIGVATMFNNTGGSNNVAVGQQALGKNTTGNDNTAVGDFALSNNTTGGRNTAIGRFANVSSGDLHNATALGNEAVVNASNKVRIGNSAVTVIEGQVPFTTPSDGRFKFAVKEDVKGLDFVMELRPVTYQFDVRSFDAKLGNDKTESAVYEEATRMRRTGFIAQEVERAAIKTGYNFSGIIKPKNPSEHYSLSYDAFVVPLVKAVQEQQQVIDQQNRRIADLEREMEAIKKLLLEKK
jgi:trimeric autotransporter adhesin